MGTTEWKNYQDVLDDFDMLSEFYDPNVKPFELFNVDSSRIPKSSRGRGRRITESDSDDSFNFESVSEQPNDSNQFDLQREIEVQEALRQACGVGYSNNVIEEYWRVDQRYAHEEETPSPTAEVELTKSEDEEELLKTASASKQSPNHSSRVTLDENINSEDNRSTSSKFSNNENSNKSESGKSGKIYRRTISSRKCAANFPKLSSPDNSINNSCNKNDENDSSRDFSSRFMFDPDYIKSVSNIDYDSSSSDENIIVESHEIVKKSQKSDVPSTSSMSPQKTTNGKRKNRTKFKPLPDVDIRVPLSKLSVNNDYNKIPVEKQLEFSTGKSKLNPNAKPFVSCFDANNSSRSNNSYQLYSQTDFPHL